MRTKPESLPDTWIACPECNGSENVIVKTKECPKGGIKTCPRCYPFNRNGMVPNKTVCDRKPRKVVIDGLPMLELITIPFSDDPGPCNDLVGRKMKDQHGIEWDVVYATSFTVTLRRELLPSERTWWDRLRLWSRSPTP